MNRYFKLLLPTLICAMTADSLPRLNTEEFFVIHPNAFEECATFIH